MNKQCVNCPGAEDHTTAECPVMSEAMEPIHPAHAALLMGKRPEPCEPFVEISSKVLARLLDVVEFGDQLERVEKDNLLSSLKDLLALEQPELWVIHSVGPNELHPMVSKEAAELHAAELAEMFKEHIGKLGLRFDVIRSPFTPLEHFEALAEAVIEHRDNLLQHVEALEKKTGESAAPADCGEAWAAARLTTAQCIWKRDWETGAYQLGCCEQAWHFTDGTAEENGALFCHRCAGEIMVEERVLRAYQVGDNDIVAAYDPAGAVEVLAKQGGYSAGDFTVDDVEPVSDKVLDSTEAYAQDEGKTITLDKTLRQELEELTEPAYLHGWE